MEKTRIFQFMCGALSASMMVLIAFRIALPPVRPLPATLSKSPDPVVISLAESFQSRLAYFERVHSDIGKWTSLMRYTRAETEAARDRFYYEFTELFRHDPRGAVAMLETVSEPFRSECFRLLGHYFEHKYADEKGIPVPKLKLAQFSKGFIGTLDADVQIKIWNWLSRTDPEAVASVLRGEVAGVEPASVLTMLDGYSLEPNMLSAIRSLALSREVSPEAELTVSAAFAAINSEDLARLVEEIDERKTLFEEGDTAFRSLSRRLAERNPDAALSLLNRHPESSWARLQLIEDLARQGIEVEHVDGEADRATAARGLMMKAIRDRKDVESLTMTMDRLGDASDDSALLAKELEMSLRRPGDLSPILPALFQTKAPDAMDVAARFIAAWAKQDIGGASRALAETLSDHAVPDSVLVPFIEEIHRDPEATAYWALLVRDTELRSRYTQRAIAELEQTDPAAAARLRPFLP